MRPRLVAYAWTLSCTVALGGLFTVSCAQSSGTPAPAALATVASSAQTLAEYGITQWLATSSEGKITWTGVDAKGVARGGVTVSTQTASGASQVTLGVIYGVPGELTVLTHADGKATVVGTSTLTAEMGKLAVRAVGDLVANSGTSGTAAFEPRIAEGLRALGVGADGCKASDVCEGEPGPRCPSGPSLPAASTTTPGRGCFRLMGHGPRSECEWRVGA